MNKFNLRSKKMKGYELATLRKEANLSQAEFGERVGLTQACISKLEAGINPIDKFKAQYFLNFFCVKQQGGYKL